MVYSESTDKNYRKFVTSFTPCRLINNDAECFRIFPDFFFQSPISFFFLKSSMLKLTLLQCYLLTFYNESCIQLKHADQLVKSTPSSWRKRDEIPTIQLSCCIIIDVTQWYTANKEPIFHLSNVAQSEAISPTIKNTIEDELPFFSFSIISFHLKISFPTLAKIACIAFCSRRELCQKRQHPLWSSFKSLTDFC